MNIARIHSYTITLHLWNLFSLTDILVVVLFFFLPPCAIDLNRGDLPPGRSATSANEKKAISISSRGSVWERLFLLHQQNVSLILCDPEKSGMFGFKDVPISFPDNIKPVFINVTFTPENTSLLTFYTEMSLYSVSSD